MSERLDLTLIKERAGRATPGPWVYSPERDTHDSPIHRANANEVSGGYIGPDGGGVVGSSEWIWLEDHDGEFIAHAREDVPALVAEVERLRDYFTPEDVEDERDELNYLYAHRDAVLGGHVPGAGLSPKKLSKLIKRKKDRIDRIEALVEKP